MTFSCVHEAMQLWIKGREFTVARLLGDKYKDQAERYISEVPGSPFIGRLKDGQGLLEHM